MLASFIKELQEALKNMLSATQIKTCLWMEQSAAKYHYAIFRVSRGINTYYLRHMALLISENNTFKR